MVSPPTRRPPAPKFRTPFKAQPLPPQRLHDSIMILFFTVVKQNAFLFLFLFAGSKCARTCRHRSVYLLYQISSHFAPRLIDQQQRPEQQIDFDDLLCIESTDLLHAIAPFNFANQNKKKTIRFVHAICTYVLVHICI